MEILNKIKSKLIDSIIASGRYLALREGLYDEVFCKSYCSIEVPSTILETQAAEECTRVDALRKVMLNRVMELRGKGIVNISDDQFEVFKNELHQSVHCQNKLINTAMKRTSRDGGWQGNQSGRLRITIPTQLSEVITRRVSNPHEFVLDAINSKLKEMGYDGK